MLNPGDDMNDATIIALFAARLQQTCLLTVRAGKELQEMGELLVQTARSDSNSQIPERFLQLSSTILTEMDLIGNLLQEEVKQIQEKQK